MSSSAAVPRSALCRHLYSARCSTRVTAQRRMRQPDDNPGGTLVQLPSATPQQVLATSSPVATTEQWRQLKWCLLWWRLLQTTAEQCGRGGGILTTHSCD